MVLLFAQSSESRLLKSCCFLSVVPNSSRIVCIQFSDILSPASGLRMSWIYSKTQPEQSLLKGKSS